jgi:hypothetical protein
MHKLFREWNKLENKARPPAFVKTFPVLVGGLLGLVKDLPDDDALRAEIASQVRNSEAMAVAMFHQAASALPEPPSPDRPVNPYAVGLNPDTWESDGLFDEPGMTLEQAKEIVAGVDAIWDDSVNPFAGMSGPPPGVTGGPPAGVAGGPPPGIPGGPPAGVAGGPPPGVPGAPAR